MNSEQPTLSNLATANQNDGPFKGSRHYRSTGQISFDAKNAGLQGPRRSRLGLDPENEFEWILEQFRKELQDADAYIKPPGTTGDTSARQHHEFESNLEERLHTKKLVESLVKFVSKTKLRLSEDEILLGLLFKQDVDVYIQDKENEKWRIPNPFHLLELVINRNFDRDFDPLMSIDWDRFFRFRNRVDIRTVEIEDPLVRATIRKNNKAYARETYGSGIMDKIDGLYPQLAVNPKVFLTLLELGLLSGRKLISSDVIKPFLRELNEGIKKLIDPAKADEADFVVSSPTKKSPSKHPSSHPYGGSTSKHGHPSMVDTGLILTDMVANEAWKGKVPRNLEDLDWSCLPQLVILSHLLVLLNDEVFLHNWGEKVEGLQTKHKKGGDAKTKLKYSFEGDNQDMKQVHNDCIAAILDCIKDLPKDAEVINNPELQEIVNRLLLHILHEDKDFYTASIHSLHHPGARSEMMYSLLQDTIAEQSAVASVEDIQELTCQIIENYYQGDQEGHISSSLTAKVISLFKLIQQRSTSVGFQVNFGVQGGANCMLTMLHLLSRYWETDPSVKWIISKGLFILSTLCKDNHIIGTQMFKARSWEIIDRLAAFDPTYVGVLLAKIGESSILQLQSCQSLCSRITTLFQKTFKEARAKLRIFSSKPDEFWSKFAPQGESGSVDRNHELQQCLVGTIMLCNTLTVFVEKATENHFKKSLQLVIQEELYEFLAEISIPFLFDASKWEALKMLQIKNPDAFDIYRGPILIMRQDFGFDQFFQNWRYNAATYDYPEAWDNLTKGFTNTEREVKNESSNHPLRIEQTELVFQTHYFLLSLFNECVTGIELKHVKLKMLGLLQDPRSKSKTGTIISTDKFKHLGIYNYGIYYLEVLLRVYTNCVLLETDIDNETLKVPGTGSYHHTPEGLAQASGFSVGMTQAAKNKKNEAALASLRRDQEVIKYNCHCTEIFELIQQLADQPTNRFKQEYEEMNRRFMFRGMLRMMIKFLKGLIFEKDKFEMSKIEVTPLICGILDRKDFFFDMCNTPEESRRRFNNERSRFILKSRNPDEYGRRSLREDAALAQNNLHNATTLMEILSQLYNDFKKYQSEIGLYTRETAEVLQDGPTKIFEHISNLGSACLVEFSTIMKKRHGLLEKRRKDAENLKKNSVAIKQEPAPVEMAKPKPSSKEELEEKLPTTLFGNKISVIPTSRLQGEKSDRPQIAATGSGPFSRPNRANSRPSTSQTAGLQAGGEVGDSKHELLPGVRQDTNPELNRSLNGSVREREPPKKTARDFFSHDRYEEGVMLQQKHEQAPESMTHPDWKYISAEVERYLAAKRLSVLEEYGVDEENKRSKSKSFILRLIEESNGEANQAYAKAVIGWIMHYFHQQKKDGTSDSDRSEGGISGLLFIRNPVIVQMVTIFGNLLTLRQQYRETYFEMYFTNLNDEDESLKIGKQFIRVLLESAIAIQKQIKDSVFTSDICIICENYFLICLTLKGIVEGNQLRMKEIIGTKILYHPDETGTGTGPDSKNPRYPLKEMFEGLALDTNPDSKTSRLTTTDRADLSWYNIVTLWTLTEFLSGPCEANQKTTVTNFEPVFLVLRKINMNPVSIMYQLQDAMATFLSAVLEENTPETCKVLRETISPEYVYNIMCQHVHNLYNLALRVRAPADIEMDRLMNLYKSDEKFNQHPSINVAVRLYFMLKSLAVPGMSKRYENFVTNKENERVEIRKESGFFSNFIGNKVVGLFQTEKLDLDADGDEQLYRDNSTAGRTGIGSNSADFRNMKSSRDKKTATESAAELHKPTAVADKNQLVIYDFVSEITASVEILFQNPSNPAPSKLQVYFPRQPETFLITQENMSEFTNTCAFKDSNSKVLDLMNFVSAYCIEMSNNKEIYKNYPRLENFAREDAFNVYKLVLWVLGLAINILALTSLRFTPDPVYDSRGVEFAIAVLEIIIVSLAACSLLLWVLFKYPEKVLIQKNHSASNKYINDRNELMQMYDVYLGMSLLNQLAPLSYLIHICAVVLRMVGSPWFFSLHLINIVCISYTTRYVIKSITKHYYQLIATLILTFIAIYSFSVIVGSQYGRTFPDYGTEADISECASMASCLLFVTDLGLRNGGGIGDALNPVPQKDPSFIGNIILHLGFFILINLVALNIVFGIILDTFAELRDNQQARENDTENVCFICGYERKTFEKQEKKFSQHTAEEHNLWYYVYYLIYLRGKNASDYTGIEYYVMEKYKSRNTDWFPIQNTRYIQADDEKGIKKLQDSLVQVLEDFKDIQGSLKKIKDHWKLAADQNLHLPQGPESQATAAGEKIGFEAYADRKWREKLLTTVKELELEVHKEMAEHLHKADLASQHQTDSLSEVLVGIDRLRLLKKQ